MIVELTPDFEVSDASCRNETGKTLKQWFAAMEKHPDNPLSRRDAINWLYAEMNKNIWWPTTVWVEYERSKGVVNKKDGLGEGYNICVTKTINAPVSAIYELWTKNDLLKKWWGNRTRATVKNDGTFDDGDGHTGTYLRVRDDKDLRFNWLSSPESHVTQVDVSFADKGKGKTGITLNHQRIQSRDEADGLRRAWSIAFEQLKKLAE